jgi:hypothetical protein
MSLTLISGPMIRVALRACTNVRTPRLVRFVTSDARLVRRDTRPTRGDPKDRGELVPGGSAVTRTSVAAFARRTRRFLPCMWLVARRAHERDVATARRCSAAVEREGLVGR